MAITLTLNNFGPFRAARWVIPQGVSALVGPNGAGKTSLLKALEFWQQSFFTSMSKALQALGGAGKLRHWDAQPTEFVSLSLEESELGGAARLEIGMNSGGVDPRIGEELRLRDEVLFQRSLFGEEAKLRDKDWKVYPGQLWLLPRDVEDMAKGAKGRDALRPLEALWSFKLYQSSRYDIDDLRRSGSGHSSDTALNARGSNVFTVLRNWRDKRSTRSRWDFVREAMRAAFPGMFDDLEFESAGNTIAARVALPGREATVPHALMSDGWFHGLLDLTAVASANDNSLVAFDELETALHPHAIYEIIRCFRQWAKERGLSIMLATHSPVVLNQFHEEREAVFVLEPGLPVQPVSLEEHPDAEWLQHFSVGDSYAQERVGAPKVSSAAE